MAYLIKRPSGYYLGERIHGRETRKTLKTSNWKEAKIKLAEHNSGLVKAGSRLTRTSTAEVVEVYLEHRKQTVAPRTYLDTVIELRMLFGPICPALTQDPNNKQQQGAIKRWKRDDGSIYTRIIRQPIFEDITTRDIADWLRDRVRVQKWDKRTASHKRATASALWKWALRTYGLRRTGAEVEPNPVAAVQTYKAPAPLITWLNRHQITDQLDALDVTEAVEELEAKLKQPVAPVEFKSFSRRLNLLKVIQQVQAMVATYIYAGLRLNEALHLQQQDVNLDRKLLYIGRKDAVAGGWQPKGNRNRVVPISSDLMPYLKAQQDRARIVTGAWFFPSPLGLQWDEHTFARKLRGLNKDAGLTWSPQDYRHTFASILIQQGVSAEHIASLMGNSADVVRKHYAALLNEHMADQVEFRPWPAAVPSSAPALVSA